MQAGSELGRSKEGWRVGRREQGEDGGGREGSRGGREEAMMLGREKASVEEGMVEGWWVDEGTERGMDSADGKMGGTERAEEGLSEEGWEQGGKGIKGRKKTSREVSRGGHMPVYSIFTNHSTTRPFGLRLWYYK